ncbi:Phosphatidate cytidylyltransferase [bacterium HR08]|uniref:Phosphatidate cytidylyltransferase n=1 Tax=uncultured Acidobacteriota bacterium TaxID=171953 RepID=H5SFD3_9BACT|nr:phosphatidate cytidylyltransferase [uncultured Acidobacteriota bacterium]GBC77304.1 Phosphatidate cytidylyltransferase [bacterium HR08]
MARVLTALVLLPFFVFALWASSPHYLIGWVVAGTLLGLHEFYTLAERAGYRSDRGLGYATALVVLFGFYQQNALLILGGLLLLLALTLALSLFTAERFERVLPESAVTVAGVLYVAVCLGFLILLRVSTEARMAARLLSLFFLIIFAGDTAAYYVGRALGRHKLAPRVSPGKTIEGAAGGVLGSVLAALGGKFWFFEALPIAHAIGLALILNAIGQIGDLVESMLKRGSNLKDAGRLLPGHGGILDRADSILFNAPIIYIYSRLLLS